MKLPLFLAILISVGLSAFAQLALKSGVTAARSGAPNGNIVLSLYAYLTSPMVIGGLALYGIGAILWLFVLARLPLTAAYPFVGLGFIFTMVLGVLALGETVTPVRLVGTLLIALGCICVARSLA